MTPQNRKLTVGALLLSMFMAAMEATCVSTAMPTVIADLGGLSLYGWVGASYLLASTVSVPLYGKLADRRGRKPVLLIGIALFLAGSLATGLSVTIEQLIAFRALQGLGAGAVQPIVMTVIGDLYEPSQRGRVQGLFGAVWGIAGVAGPLLGGAIVHALSWRWVFLVNLPPGIFAMIALSVFYREPARARAGAPLDIAGAITITLASLALLLAASEVLTPLMASASVLLLVAFVWLESRAKDPVVPLPLLKRRLIAVASIASLLWGAAMMGVLNFLPLHVQGVLGELPTVAGLVIAPMLVGWPLSAALTTRLLTRIGYKKPLLLGAAITTLSLFGVVPLISAGSPPWTLGIAMFAFGVGMGLANTAAIIGVQASVGYEQRGVATATTMFARSMGSALGVGALGAILAQRLEQTISADVASALLDPLRREAALADPLVLTALEAALGPLFWSGGIAGALSLVAVWFYPPDAPKSSAPTGATSA